MSSVENIELRRRLEEMTVRGDEPVNHRGLLVGISKSFPNTIQPLESSLPEGCYTCSMYVLHFSKNEEYIKVAGFGFPPRSEGRDDVGERDGSDQHGDAQDRDEALHQSGKAPRRQRADGDAAVEDRSRSPHDHLERGDHKQLAGYDQDTRCNSDHSEQQHDEAE